MMFVPDKKQRKRIEGYSVAILTPVQGYENYARFTKSVVNMVAYSWMHGLKILQIGMTERMVVDWARNSLARTSKDHLDEYTGEKYTHLLWLDDDHVFNPDLALRLAVHDKDMVSALYYGRHKPHKPVVYVRDPSDDGYKHFPMIEVPRTLFECDAAGFGAMLMRRDVLDRVPEPWFTVDTRGGEDLAFCVRAKEQGVKIWCDGTYRLGHVGMPEVITQENYEHYRKEHPEEFADMVRVELGGHAPKDYGPRRKP